MSSEDERGVHRPDDGRDHPTRADDAGEAPAATAPPEPAPDGFGSRGWVLVAVLAGCTLVVPGIIYVRPGILSAVGIPYIASLLVLPLVPAVALGLVAVWAMTAATGEE